MNNTKKNTVDKLKDLIDKNGPEYLSNEPYQTYKELMDFTATDAKIAGGILMALVRGIERNARSDENHESLSKWIQKECCFNKKMADRLAEIFCMLYSKDYKKMWEARNLNGWTQFQKSDFCCGWNGFTVWITDGGSVDCHFEADMILKPMETIKIEEELSRELSKNPFMTQETITEYYTQRIRKYLDEEFEEYCTCEDYYQPVVEDFDIDYYVNQWCKENSFEFVSCEGSGYDGGYEPSFRHGGY